MSKVKVTFELAFKLGAKVPTYRCLVENRGAFIDIFEGDSIKDLADHAKKKYPDAEVDNTVVDVRGQ